MKTLNILFCSLVIWNSELIISQETLSLEDAIAISMAKNFDIQIANNNLLISENNKSIQNSGYLPKVVGNANANYSNNNAFIVRQDGTEASIDGIEATSYNASLGLNYTIYGGGKRQNQFDKLKTVYELSDAQRKQQINTVLFNVYTSYYNIAKSATQIETLEEAIAISLERLIRTGYQAEFGQKTKLDVLNSKVDVNNDSLNLINANIQIQNAKQQLVFLLGQSLSVEFSVNKEVSISSLIDYQTIYNKMFANNYQVKQINLNKTMSEYDLKINQSGWKPNISTNLSYGYNSAQNGPASLFAEQNSNGINAGLSLNWNIFDGGATQVKIQNAKLNIENQNVYKKQLEMNLVTQLNIAWADYKNQTMVINTAKENLNISEQNFAKTQERFNLGQISSIDFRQAQLNMIKAQIALTNAKFSAKLAEIQLQYLSSDLIK